jgi:PAS domain S-box-containing protein
LATAILFDVVARSGLVIQTPFPVMILTVVYAAIVGGIRPASISALVTTVYAVHFFSDRVGFLVYDSAGFAGLVSTAAAAWIAALAVARVARVEPAPIPRELTEDEADAIRRRLSLLEHASTVLASSLDYETTVGRMLRLLVPTMADWCTVHLATPSGRLRFVAGAHRDISREILVRALGEQEDPPFGTPERADAIPLSPRALDGRESERTTLIRQLAPSFAIRVPIIVRESTAGVLTLVLAESGRSPSAEDIELAQELADRIALALANAMLHGEAAVAARSFEALFAAHPQPMWIFDPDTLRFLSVNQAAIRQYGYDADEFAAMTIMDLVPRADEIMPPIVPPDRGGVRGGVALTHHQRKDGTIVEMELTSHQVDLNGQRGRLVVATDVSERTRALTSLHRMEDQLRQAQRMEVVGRLGIGVAHDFNNVLTSIRGFGELLARDLPPGDPRRPGAERILQAADRGTLLARQLLAFGDRQPLQPRPVDLNAVIVGMEGLIRRLAGDDVEVTTTMADRLGAVQVDPVRLEQAVISLILGAREAMPSGGTMTIETSERYIGGFPTGRHLPPGEYAVLAINDTGDDVETERRSRPLDRRAGDELGLRVVNSIVRQSGGMVRVTSEPGAGRTVKIFLPLVTADETPTLAMAAPTGTETVLVVEDEDAVRELLRRTLSRVGYRVLEARDGGEATRVAQRHDGRIHLLITDVVLPGMNGGELATELTRARPDLEVIFMSGYADNEVARRGVRRDPDSFLDKPFSSENLLRLARTRLDHQAAV